MYGGLIMKMEIIYKGIEFEVDFDYQPEEAAVMYYSDGTGHPGCAEELTINSIKHKGTDFIEFLEDDFEQIEEKLLDFIHTDDRY